MARIENWNFNGVFRRSKSMLSVYSVSSFPLKVISLAFSVSLSLCRNSGKFMQINGKYISFIAVLFTLLFEFETQL
jgi:hypothetical protein